LSDSVPSEARVYGQRLPSPGRSARPGEVGKQRTYEAERTAGILIELDV
jgi:hypothetical protein